MSDEDNTDNKQPVEEPAGFNEQTEQQNFPVPAETILPAEPKGKLSDTHELNNQKPLDLSSHTDWIAPEFIVHEKSTSWYLKLVLAAFITGAILALLTRDLITVVVVVLAVLLLGMYGLRKPKDIRYALNDEGVNIGDKIFSYAQFRSFTVIAEGNYLNITLIPLKRFAPPVGMCCLIDMQEKVLNYLSERLPFEQHRPDIIELLMLRIRF